MWVTGIDENGMGPLLGPLVCTAFSLEVGRYESGALRALGVELGLGDSKQTSGFGKMRRAESLALACVAELMGEHPRDVDGLLAALALGGTAPLHQPCPHESVARACWGRPIALPAFGGDVEEGRRWLAQLRDAGVVARHLRTSIVCVRRLNLERRAGRNKLQVDLRAFEELLLDASAAAQSRVLGVCGKVGGITRYGSYFERLPLEERATLLETHRESRYRWGDWLETWFAVDADDGHLPVGLASMVGKYVRELLMLQQVDYYRAHDPTLESVSGYRDPRTKRFVEHSASLRRDLGILDECFLREG